MAERPLGPSGRLARRFLGSEITPLLALVGLLLGVFAVLVTPKEEEPQIDVTFANVFIPFPGATAEEVERLVATPAEQVFSELKGVKHVYSVSRPGMAVLTVRFQVGVPRTEAIVRLYNQVYSHADWLPANLGVGQPLVRPMGIDDVPILTLTLWTRDGSRGGYELAKVAHAIEVELKRVPGTRQVYTVGGADDVVHVRLDPARLAGYGIGLEELRAALLGANVAREAGALVAGDRETTVRAGTLLASAHEVASLVVGLHRGRPVYLRDVAEVSRGPEDPRQYVWIGAGPAAASLGLPADLGEQPAVTVAVAKKPGTNAVVIARRVLERVAQLRGTYLPEGVEVTVTRNYGRTASDKANKLIAKLVFATATVILLVLATLGWREAVVVGTAVVVTLAITLFASWAWGFTINRVSLFALIFSIGILVDDAIVVVENVHRHMQLGDRPLRHAIPAAVDEVGGPTILATFTVIAALLPMAFVTGLMGPYMSPIPINASTGMLISLAVAFVVTPWFCHRLLRRHRPPVTPEGEVCEGEGPAALRLYRLFRVLLGPFLDPRHGRWRRWALLGATLVLMAGSVWLVLSERVVLKMLPFDNKSELQLVVELPEGSTLERTAQVLHALGERLRRVPEVAGYVAYAGTASPINFNGLVRQYYLRQDPRLGDIQINLVDKHHRERQSHEIALALRPALQAVAARYGATLEVVEVPPGPPVQAPLVAEIYGPDYAGQQRVARLVRRVFASTPDVVDVNDSLTAPGPRLLLQVDRQKAALLGVDQRSIADALAVALGGEDLTYLHGAHVKYPVPVRLELPLADRARARSLLDLKVRARSGRLVPLWEMVRPLEATREPVIFHKDLLPVVYVTGNAAGELDSPLYAMFAMLDRLRHTALPGGGRLEQHLLAQPEDPYRYGLKWDGEWQVTYETFRDMGVAYAVGLVLIYLLVVAEFRSYLAPIVIMAPIPLTVVGVMPGHALLGAQFTATSMIGMIALAGIIVRNSILLVDFVRQAVREGVPLEEAVIRSGAVRAKPIVLTALAAMLGAFFILDDPIFKGLAVSLIFGVFVSTLLTLVVIPVMYYALIGRKEARRLQADGQAGEAGDGGAAC